jgi:hypothetical protein
MRAHFLDWWTGGNTALPDMQRDVRLLNDTLLAEDWRDCRMALKRAIAV